LIRSRAQAAIESLRDARPPQVTLPADLSVTFRNGDLAELATWVTGVERTGTTTVRLRSEDPIRLFRTFITAVLLTRDIAE
jgi:D-amino peptidase